MKQAHTDELRQATDLASVEFQPHPDEVEVTVKAGDLVIGDSRLIHSAHANDSDQRRTVITMWFFPNYTSLPQPIAGFIAGLFRDMPDEMASWNPQVRKRLYDLRPIYRGREPPLTFSRNRLTRDAFLATQRGNPG